MFRVSSRIKVKTTFIPSPINNSSGIKPKIFRVSSRIKVKTTFIPSPINNRMRN
jgi:hypothetical protein